MSWLSCLLVDHDPMHPRQARDDEGQLIPGGVEYECSRCGRTVRSEMDLAPSQTLIDALGVMASADAKARRKARQKQVKRVPWQEQNKRRTA